MQRFSSWLGVKFSPCICSHGLIGCTIFRNPAIWNVNFKWSSLWCRLLKSKDYKVQWTVTVFFLMHTLQCWAIVLSLGPFHQLKERPGLHCLHMCKYTRILGITKTYHILCMYMNRDICFYEWFAVCWNFMYATSDSWFYFCFKAFLAIESCPASPAVLYWVMQYCNYCTVGNHLSKLQISKHVG